MPNLGVRGKSGARTLSKDAAGQEPDSGDCLQRKVEPAVERGAFVAAEGATDIGRQIVSRHWCENDNV